MKICFGFFLCVVSGFVSANQQTIEQEINYAPSMPQYMPTEVQLFKQAVKLCPTGYETLKTRVVVRDKDYFLQWDIVCLD